MQAFPRTYGEWVVRWRWPVLIASLSLALGLGYFAAGQHYYNPYDIWFLPTDPGLSAYRQLTRQFGEDDFVIVAFRDPAGIFTNPALEAILDLTEELERTPLMERVTSITNYQYTRSRVTDEGEDELLIEDLVRRDHLPLTSAALQERQRMALGERPAVGTLIGPPAHPRGPVTVAAVVARVDISEDEPENSVIAVDRILSIARQFEAKHGYRVHVAGVPVVEHAFETFGRSEMITFTSALLAVVAVLLLVVFRRLAGMVLSAGAVILAMPPTLGAMALLGIWFNPLTTIIPPIVITVGVADAVHVTAGFFARRRRGADPATAVAQALEENFLPCFITTLTTAIGFLSLSVATLVPMRQFGMAAALGVAFAWLFTVTFLPAALAVWPARGTAPPARRGAMAAAPDARFQRLADLIVGWVVPRPRTVMLAALVVFAGIMLFALRLEVETSYKNMFKPHTELRKGLAFIEDHLGGSEDIEIAIDSGRSDGVKDPEFLRQVEAIQAFVVAQPGVSSTFSLLDILKQMNQVMRDDDPAMYRVPESAELSAQYLLLYTLGSPREDLKDRVDVDSRWTRVSGRNRALSSTETLAMGERIRRYIREEFPGLQANVTGKAMLYTGMQEDMARNTIGSFATALVPITLVQAIMFRSLRVGLLTMLPNMLPIVAMVGMMGLLRIPLDPGSAMVASVGIGIVVDDTVHFFSRYLGRRAAGASPPDALRYTLGAVGRPVVYTTFILAVGFSLFSFSAFNFIAYFGQLATCLVILALLADLFVTPALFLVFDRPRPGQPGGSEPR